VVEGLDGFSITAERHGVWVGGRASVTRIDPATGKVVAAIPVNGVGASMATAIAPGYGAIWFTGSSQPQLIEISESANAVAGSSPVGGGPVAVATGAGSVWVANGSDRTISRVDASGASARTIPLGTPPGAVVFYRGDVWVSAGQPVS
jgi:streptogramin lyase